MLIRPVRGVSSVPLSMLTMEMVKVSVASDWVSLMIGTGISTLPAPAAMVVVRITPVWAVKSWPAIAVSLSRRYSTVTACEVSPVRVTGMKTVPSRSPMLSSLAPSWMKPDTTHPPIRYEIGPRGPASHTPRIWLARVPGAHQ